MTHSNRFASQLQPQVLDIQPYLPGKPIEEVQRELGLANILKLASNENPLGCSPRVTAAIQNHLCDIHLYPDGNAYYLKQSLSQFLECEPEQLLIGNGSNEVLELIARAFAGTGDEIVYAQYAFAVYAISTQGVGATAVEVPAKNYGHDLEAMANAVTDKTKVIYLANPNNPTGTLFSQTELEQFMQQIPQHVIVVLDEAYFEYVTRPDYPDSLALLANYPNLVLTRTFSKAYGLAGLRIGYLVGNKEIISYLNRLREPFNVNSLALVAAKAALQDQSFVHKSVEMNQQSFQILTDFLEQHQIRYIPSAGNFITVEVGAQAKEINACLLSNGIIVRPLENYKLPHHLRLSLGTPREMQRFIRVFQEVLQKYQVISSDEKTMSHPGKTEASHAVS